VRAWSAITPYTRPTPIEFPIQLRIPDDDAIAALDRVRDEDPFTKLSMAQYELLPWNPVIGQDGLDRL
jgi:hypothetical protein